MKKGMKKVVATTAVATFIANYGMPYKAYADEVKEKDINSIYKESLAKEKEAINNSILKNKADETVRFIVEVNDSKDLKKVKNKVSSLKGIYLKNEYKDSISGFSVIAKRSQIKDIASVDGVSKVNEAMAFKIADISSAEISKAVSAWKDYGYKGEGMVISIIDSGIDINHKDLRLTDPSKAKIKEIKNSSQTKFTAKVPYGRNFAENTDYVMETSKITGNHGMHVAGIVAANGEGQDGLRGIAPEAQLLAMKVFENNTGMCYEDDIVAAIDDSVAHGADIINMSLGFFDSTPNNGGALKKAVDRAKAKGVLVVIAAGNEAAFSTKNSMQGPIQNNLETYDNEMLRYPGNVQSALTVAAFENPQKPYGVMDVKGNSGEFKVNFETSEGPYEAAEKNKGQAFNLFNMPATPGVKDDKYNNSFILVKYDDKKTFQEFAAGLANMPNAAATEEDKVPRGLIIYGNIKEADKANFALMGSRVVFLNNEDGEKLQKSINDNLKIAFTSEVQLKDNGLKDKMSTFSSFGPTVDLDFKPDITGIGGNVLSTLNGNKYGVMSGTSMASPNVAGAEALIIQAIKNSKLNLKNSDLVDFAKNTVLNTSQVIEDKEHDSIPYSPRRQGAGLIQIDKAIKNRVLAVDAKRNISNIALGEIENEKTFDVKIKNYGNEEVTFNLNNSDVLSEKVAGDNKEFTSYVIKDATVKPNINEITLKAGEEKTITFNLSLPSSLEKNKFVEGFINLNSKDKKNPDLVIPYMAFYGDFSTENTIDRPLWEKDTKLKSTGIKGNGLEFLGQESMKMGADGQLDVKVNPENIAISTNDDSLNKEALAVVGLLRNAKELNVEVVDGQDGKENVLKVLEKRENAFRLSAPYSSLLGIDKTMKWDGKIYDANKQGFVGVKEGKYYIRVRAKGFTEKSREDKVYMPIKVDNTAPKINLANKEIITQGDKKVLKLSWNAKDEGSISSGINKNNLRVVIDGEVKKEYGLNDNLDFGNLLGLNGAGKADGQNEKSVDGTFAKDNGNYETLITLKDGKIPNVALGITDGAGNTATISTETLVYSNLKDGDVINKAKLNKDNKLELSGMISQDIKKVQVNGVEAQISNGSFKVALELPQGDGAIKTVAYDDKGAVKFNSETKVSVDTIAPEAEYIKYKLMSSDEKGNKDYKIYGKLKNKEVNPKDIKITVKDMKVELKEDSTFEFNYKFNKEKEDSEGGLLGKLLGSGISINITDKAGNSYGERLSLEDLYYKMKNVNPLVEGSIVMPNVVEDGKAYIEGEVAEDVTEIKFNNQVAKLEGTKYSIWVPVKAGQTTAVSVVLKDKNGKEKNEVLRLLYVKDSLSFNTNIESIKYTNKDVVDLTGDIKYPYGVKLEINGDVVVDNMAKLGIIVSNNDERFQPINFKKSLKLNEGSNTINVKITNIGGEVIEKQLVIVKKTTKPNLSVLNVNDNETYKNAVKVDAVSEADSTIAMTLNGKAYNGEEIKENGEYTLIVTATDKAGNVTTKTIKFKIDKPAENNNSNNNQNSNNSNNSQTNSGGNSNSTSNNTTSGSNEVGKNTQKKNEGKIAQTGSPIGSTLIAEIGALATMVGAFILGRKRK